MAMTEKELEKKLVKIESMVAEIHARLMMDAIKPGDINEVLFDKALSEWMNGNPKLLEQYLNQGGDVPKSEGVKP